MSKDQLIVSVKWMVDREVAVCGLFNRISRRPKVKTFFVLISGLGDGGAWYSLILALPFLYGQSGIGTSLNMVKVALVNLVLYKIIKQITGRARPCAISPNITVGTAPLDQYSFPSGHTMHAGGFLYRCHSASRGTGLGTRSFQQPDRLVTACARSSLSDGRDCRRSYRWIRRISLDDVLKTKGGD